MTPIYPDCVVFYSVLTCYVYDVKHLPEQLPYDPNEQGRLPSDDQLCALQRQLPEALFANKRTWLIVVPDAWLSASSHQLDHLVSKKLAPLAALAFAAESIFAAPKAIYLNYTVTQLSKNACELNVIAASDKLVNQLLAPWQDTYMPCYLVTQQQWSQRRWHRFSLWRLLAKALKRYQPEEDKRLSARRRWLAFGVLSLLLQVGLFGYFYHQDLLHEQRLNRYQMAQAQSVKLAQQGNVFVAGVLGVLRVLPTDMRLLAFYSDGLEASAQLSLRQNQLAPLLASWRQQFPNWQWTASHSEFVGEEAVAQEVINVEIFIKSS